MDCALPRGCGLFAELHSVPPLCCDDDINPAVGFFIPDAAMISSDLGYIVFARSSDNSILFL